MQESQNIYQLPLPSATKITKTVTDSPGHIGPYQGAIDYAVKADTKVLAPLDGEIITVVDHHDKYGTVPEFAPYANYIQIKHTNGETSDLMHLAKGSVLVKVGDGVKTGQTLAKTGLSGYMTEPHLHWFVFHLTDSKDGFAGLAVRLKSA